MHAIESWRAAPARLEPPAETIHVWRIELERVAEDSLLLLSTDERERAQRLNSKYARDVFTRARGAMRSILGRYLDVPPQKLRFDYRDKGKPYLCEPSSAIHFNLSHAQNLALFAVASAPVGIDLEPLRERRDLARIAARMFPQSITREISELRGDSQVRAFFYHWTHLESCAKCRGSGLFSPEVAAERVRLHSAHFIPEPGWVACLASSEPLADSSTWMTLQF
jgi:4'-phosphopantetheinyl transferase